MLLAGTRTLSKCMYACVGVCEGSQPVLRTISMPLAPAGTISIDMRLCGGASGSVTTITMKNDA